jgi:hypothetical protein
MDATIMANGKYQGSFEWGRPGSSRVEVSLSKNDHGWFCDEVNGIGWDYPGPLDPWGGWGSQVAKDSPEEAVAGFLAQWDANDEDGEGVCQEFSGLTIRPVEAD